MEGVEKVEKFEGIEEGKEATTRGRPKKVRDTRDFMVYSTRVFSKRLNHRLQNFKHSFDDERAIGEILVDAANRGLDLLLMEEIARRKNEEEGGGGGVIS